MKTVTDFETFLDSIETDNIEEMYYLKNAIENEETYGYVDIKNISEHRFIVSVTGSDIGLLFVSEKQIDTFLKIIEDRYGGELGIDMEYDYQKASEKDD